MGKVITGATMSIDGYIAGPDDTGFDLLFQWYGNGDVEIPNQLHPELSTRTSEASAQHLRDLIARTGALLVGRHLFDLTNGWDGRHPLDVTTVVTHRPPDGRPREDQDFVFVTGGIEEAVATAKGIAGDKDVGVNGGQMARQALDAGLLDEVHVDLVPVILGSGTPFFPQLAQRPVQLEGPVSVVEGTGVTHLRYVVRKDR